MSRYAFGLHDVHDNVDVDKITYVSVNYIINDTLHRYTHMNALERVLTVTAIGATKELWVDNDWSNGDFAADCAGILVYEVRF